MVITPFIIPLILFGLLPIIAIITWIATYKRYKFVRPHKRSSTGIAASGLFAALTVFMVATIITWNIFQAQNCQPSSLLAPSRPLQCMPDTVNIGGSTALVPLVRAAVSLYHDGCKSATLQVEGGGSERGVDLVEQGSIDIGDSDGPASPQRYPDLVGHPVAIMAFALIANQSLGISSLSTSQIRCIYSGQCKSWKDVQGPDSPIVALSRTVGSGTRTTFEQYVLGTNTGITRPFPLSDTDAVISEVQNNPQAIGYVAYANLQNTPPAHTDQIRTIDIDDNSPSNTLVESNTYTFWNIEYMYTKGPATGLTKAFIDYMSNDAVTTYMDSHSYISLKRGQEALMSRCQAGDL